MLERLDRGLEGGLSPDVPLSRLSTYRIGGPVSAVFDPTGPHDVTAVTARCREESVPFLVVGLGSNVLFPDTGIDAVAVRMSKSNSAVTRLTATEWVVGAGLPTPLLARRTAGAGLGGMHRLIGVPGTVGGGVYMNAGAHGQEFSQTVKSVTVVDSTGEIRELAGHEVPWTYRYSGLGDSIVVAATFEFAEADPKQLRQDIANHLRWRREGTPFDQPCCGSVFKNPADGPRDDSGRRFTAGRLIDSCDLKGYRVGAAEVSSKHANYIVNHGDATAANVLAVIEHVRECVLREFDVSLELEVKVIGQDGKVRTDV
ncbi:MAG: UDP-N-acetylmuramate dehydrogenase [Gemmatimonadales bacterium]